MLKAQLIQEYLAGPALARDAVAGMTPEQLRARPIPGRWSALEVICHLADVEMRYAEQAKRIAAEDEPPLGPAVPSAWVSQLDYQSRNIEIELRRIEWIRCQRIVKGHACGKCFRDWLAHVATSHVKTISANWRG
jgi:hypothetical protein